MSKLLLEESPILVLPSLAEKIGLNESIFLQQLHYWLKDSSNFRENEKWVYNTYEDWNSQFPFWSESTIRRIITKLENSGLLITGNFNKMKIDKTKWYRINYELLEGMSSPSVQNEQSECSERTVELSNLNRPLPEITSEITSEKEVEEEEAPVSEPKENPFKFFQENGFGMISGYMHEKINSWCKDLNDDLVLAALKLAVENGKITWRYTETILRSWAEKGVKTTEDADALQKAFREQQARQRDKPYRKNAPVRKENLPDWFVNQRQQEDPHAAKEPESGLDFEEKKKAFEEKRKALQEELKKLKK